ncbi:hypothetical protein MRX96_007451 [Rhipicephalus microplus]
MDRAVNWSGTLASDGAGAASGAGCRRQGSGAGHDWNAGMKKRSFSKTGHRPLLLAKAWLGARQKPRRQAPEKVREDDQQPGTGRAWKCSLEFGSASWLWISVTVGNMWGARARASE